MSIIKIFILSFAITAICSNDDIHIKRFLSYSKNSMNPISFLKEDSDLKSFSDDDAKFINIKCLYSKNYNLYSLQPLQNDGDYEMDYNGDSLFFNFCTNTKKRDNSTFVLVNKDNETIRLSGSIDGEGEDKSNKNTWNLIDNGLSIDFNEGDECNNGTERHKVVLEVMCKDDVDEKKFKDNPQNFVTFNETTGCLHKITMKSLYGCSLKSTYLLKKLIEDYKYIFAVLFIIIGLVLCFTGKNTIKYTIMIVCGIIGCYGLTSLVLSLFPNFITTELWLFVCLFVCFCLGCIVGIFLRNEVNFYIIVCGGFLGYSCAIFVYQIVLNYVDYDPQIVYYACIGVCIVVGILIGWKCNDPIIILGTAISGGYIAMRGVSFIAGNYLDEDYIIDLLKQKEFEQLKEIRDGWTFAYLGGWLVVSIAGVVVQCKRKKKTNSKNI